MTYIGAAVPPASGQTWAQSIASWETLVGAPMRMRRCYDGPLPSNIAVSQMQYDLGLRASLYSFKPTITTSITAMQQFAQSIVDSEHECRIIIYHEPVDNMTGADFIALYLRSAAPFRALGIPVGVCYTNYSINLPYSNSQSALHHYWPGDTEVDYVAIDEYPVNEITSTKDAMDMTLRTRRIEQWCDARSIPLGLAEYGVEGTVDPAKSDRWLRSVLQWMRIRNKLYRPLLFALYFHSNVAGSFSYRLDNQSEFVDSYKDFRRVV